MSVFPQPAQMLLTKISALFLLLFSPDVQVEGVFYVNDPLEKLMFEELRNACRGGGKTIYFRLFS